MNQKHNIPLKSIVDEFQFEKIYLPDNYEQILIDNPEVNRPGLALTGFFEIFEPSRIQMIGKAEYRYLAGLNSDDRNQKIDNFLNTKPVAVIVTSNLDIFDELLDHARVEGVPLLRTSEKTSPIMAALIPENHTPRRSYRGLRRGIAFARRQRYRKERNCH